MAPESVLSAFSLMWELFPEPVMLLHRDRTILATNALGRAAGIPLGSRCHTLNPEAGADHCRNCQANAALAAGAARVCAPEPGGAPVSGYWVPVLGHDDLYVHFGIGVQAMSQKAQDLV